jgi:hypothetical protein
MTGAFSYAEHAARRARWLCGPSVPCTFSRSERGYGAPSRQPRKPEAGFPSERRAHSSSSVRLISLAPRLAYFRASLPSPRQFFFFSASSLLAAASSCCLCRSKVLAFLNDDLRVAQEQGRIQ